MRRRTFLGGALATAATILIGTRASRTSSITPTPPSRALPTDDLAKIVPLGGGSGTPDVGIAEIAPTHSWRLPVIEDNRLPPNVFAIVGEDRHGNAYASFSNLGPGAHTHTVTIDVPPGMHGYATFLDRGPITLNPGANIIQGKKPSTATLKSVEHGETESIYRWKVGDGKRVISKDIVIPRWG